MFKKLPFWRLLLLLPLLWCTTARASHLRGDDLSYKYIGNNTYLLTLKMYRDCTGIPLASSYDLYVYDKATGTNISTLTLSQQSLNTLTNYAPGCSYPSGVCVEVGVYTNTITLASTATMGTQGWNLFGTSSARNYNIINTSSTGYLFACEIPNTTTYHNSAPTFLARPVPYYCVNKAVVFVQNGFDIDDDSLSYSMFAPYETGNAPGGPSNYASILYNAPYTAANPLATSTGFHIDSITGDISFTPTTVGNYVVGVEVKEYRRVAIGQPRVYIGSIRRDLQIVIGVSCTGNGAPVLDQTVTQLTYNVTPGQNLTFPVRATDPDLGDSLYISRSGPIFDTSGGLLPPYATMANVVHTDSARSIFSWTPSLAQARTQPYPIVVLLNDDHCDARQHTLLITVSVQPPTVQASNLVASQINTKTAKLTATAGNGNKRLFVVAQGSIFPANILPKLDTFYSASLHYKQGRYMGNGVYVVSADFKTTFTMDSLQPATTYTAAIFEFNAAGTQSRYNTTAFPTATFSTLATKPTVQSTSLTLNGATATSLDLSWTNGNGANSIVVMSTSPITSASYPVSGTGYAANANYAGAGTLGSGFVVYQGNGNSATITGLNPATIYYAAVFSYNGVGASTRNYLTTAPATGYATTLAAEPTAQAGSLTLTSPTVSGLTVSFVPGNGLGTLVVMSAAPITALPQDATLYTGSTIYGQGSAIAPGVFVVSAGTQNSFNVTGLAPGTLYYASIFEYNGATAALRNYKTSPVPMASASTSVITSVLAAEPTVQATALAFSGATTGTLQLSWTNGNGANRLVIVSTSPITAANLPVDGIAYTSSSNFAATTSSSIGGAKVVYQGTGNTLTIGGLLAGTTYYGSVFEFNGTTSSNRNYLISTYPTASGTTLALNSIATGTLPSGAVCQGSLVSLPFTVSGTYAAGNVFTAQLSDASGSFAAPVSIGTLASATAGSIACTIPPNTPAGTGYKLRMVSSSPAIIGSASAAFTVNVSPAVPTLSVAPSMQSVCAGTSVTYTATASTGASLQWYVNTVLQNGATGTTFAYVPTTNTVVTCKASNFGVCGALTTTVNVPPVTVNPLPAISIVVPAATVVCANSPIVLSANGTATSYQWLLNGAALAGATNSSYSATLPGSYTVLANPAGPCPVLSAALTLSGMGVPTVAPATAQTLCAANGAIQLTATLPATGAPYTRQWLLNGQPIANASGMTYSANATGTYTIQITNATGCTTVSNGTQLTNVPALFAGAPANVCAGAAVSLPVVAGAQYQWQSLVGSTWQNIASATTTAYTTIAPGYVRCQVQYSGCTIYSSVISVRALPTMPSILPIGTQNVCTNDSILLTASAIPAGMAGQWLRNGQPIAGATTNAHSAKVAGQYSFTLTSSYGCTSTSVLVTVNVNAAQPVYVSTACVAGQTRLSATPGFAAYQWQRNGANIAGATASTYTTTLNATYTVRATNAASGCVSLSAGKVLPIGSVGATTQLIPSWCGATGLGLVDDYVSVNSVGGAASYLFVFTDSATGQTSSIAGGTTVYLEDVLPALQYNHTYGVVAAPMTNTSDTLCFGLGCSISIGKALPTTRLAPASCGNMAVPFSGTLMANTVPYADRYTFRILNAATGQLVASRTSFSGSLPVAGLGLAPNTSYKVAVLVRKDNATAQPLPGDTCLIMTGAPGSRLQQAAADAQPLLAYPNPFTQSLTVLPSSTGAITLSDAQGRLLLTVPATAGQAVQMGTQIQPGIYILHNGTAVLRIVKAE